jgi:phage nucleotide-binding protein
VVKSVKNITTDQRLKVLVYGESGVGKTVFASSFPKPYFLAAEEGLLSIAGGNAEYDDVKRWSDLEGYYLELLKPATQKRYDTVVVDSLTSLQQLALAHVLEANNRNFPEMRDWGMLLELMRRFLRQMGDLPYNIVFNALEAQNKDELNGGIFTKPAIQGRMAEEAPAYVDIVMHLIVEEKKVGGEIQRERFGIFQPSSRAMAKDRSGKLPVVMKDPTAAKIIAKVRGVQATTKSTTGTRRRRTAS